MENRKIIYGSVSGLSGPQTIYSAARTWGELKEENQALNVAANGMTAIISGSSSKLSSNNDVLPEGEFSLYLVLDKNNSGGNA